MDNYATETDLEKIVNKYVELLQNDIRVAEVILFGSYAKGHANKDSDIDLAVISPDFGENVLRDLQLLSRKKIKVDPRIEAIAYH
ncbi:MAG: nucleotidyltransferase domain-containing protein [Bacillota bacterium]